MTAAAVSVPVALLALIFVWRAVRETKGRELEDM
jgi:hypothetical protein